MSVNRIHVTIRNDDPQLESFESFPSINNIQVHRSASASFNRKSQGQNRRQLYKNQIYPLSTRETIFINVTDSKIRSQSGIASSTNKATIDDANNNFHSNHSEQQMQNAELDQMGVTQDIFPKSTRNIKNKYCTDNHLCSCCSPLIAIVSVISVILLASGILTGLLVFMRSHTPTTIMTTTTTTSITKTTTITIRATMTDTITMSTNPIRMSTTTMPSCINSIEIPSCARWNQTGITVAGDENGVSGSDLSLLDFPITIFVDNNDTLFVVDGNNNRIVKYYPNATSAILVAGNLISGSNASLLNQPKGVAVDDMGNVFVADAGNYRIQKFPPDSQVATTITSNSTQYPLGLMRDLHIDCNNDVYVTDSDNNRVVKYNPNNGTRTIIVGIYGEGSAADQFSSPFGSFIDKNETVYVVDLGNQRVQKWFAGATSGITVVGTNSTSGSSSMYVSNPTAAVIDNNGYIYVADGDNDRIMRWTLNYTAGGSCIVGCSNTSGSASNQLDSPRDLKFDSQGNLYVTDQNNNRIQKYSIQFSSNCSIKLQKNG